ncbi:uncharacterized protein LOC128229178 isoform X3 [Mya arenaria]|uniref:uncharacterized protein LOC128229178 isoform X3 n=1 Tax=Mya arenaria TaxID=6604 RepID=UPI0022E18631|nr:uncharacterized protein LOC128229178 isoform X3 [Mya arenaria]
MLKAGVLLLVALVAWSEGQSADLSCPNEVEAETDSLAAEGIYSLNKFEQIHGKDAEIVKERLGVSATQETIANQMKIEMDANRELAEFVNGEREADAQVADLAFPNYSHTCPYKWISLSWSWYYWRIVVSNKPKVLKFCIPYYNVWVTRCYYKNCHNSYSWFPNDLRFRCFDEYRYIRVRALCLKITYDDVPKVDWVSCVIPIRVPYGCCCRKYWPFITAQSDACAVKG